MTLEKKTYTDSAMSDEIKEFFNRFKENNSYKYIELIDSQIIQNKVIEIDYNEFTDEVKGMLENQSNEKIHTAIYRAMAETFQTRHGSGELNEIITQDMIKFKIINSDILELKIWSNPKLPEYDYQKITSELEEPELSEYAKSIMSDYTFKTFEDTDEVLYCSKGVYEFYGEVLIKKECQKIIPECTKHQVSEIIGIIQRETYTKRSLFNNDFSKLVFENGMFERSTGKLLEYDKDFLTTIKFPINYDSKARCPRFIKFLKGCLHPDSKAIITVIEEMANILSFDNLNLEISGMWIGDGANGKSTCLKIIEGILGKKNCSHVSIHAMQNQRFATSQLDGKPVNIYADISNRELNNLGLFKQIISGETISVEKKNKDAFDLNSFAKHFFSANEMPDIKDNSDGAFRRIYVTKWENQFLAGVNRIENLAEIILEKEKSGIFNLMLENYKTIQKNKGFRYKQSIAKVREIIKLESDKLLEFINETLVKDPNGYIIKDQMYEINVKYCNFHSYEVYTKQKFGANLPTYGIHDDVRKINGKTKRVWFGYVWNDKSEWVKGNVSGLIKYI
ncbi:MAG: hypothetical protein COA77_06360 [Thaumarchaeota archaeon]|nr:MAG: hypothetical protein COA77_06360 [Nitrososphaerota archaeon]